MPRKVRWKNDFVIRLYPQVRGFYLGVDLPDDDSGLGAFRPAIAVVNQTATAVVGEQDSFGWRMLADDGSWSDALNEFTFFDTLVERYLTLTASPR